MVSRTSASLGYTYRRLERDQQSAYVSPSLCLYVIVGDVHYLGYMSVTVIAIVAVTVLTD